jgi:hypothetical protein
MTTPMNSKGKRSEIITEPEKIGSDDCNANPLKSGFNTYSAFIIEVEIESLIIKQWS